MKKRGEVAYRHCVVVHNVPQGHWVLTPGRSLELIALDCRTWAAAKVWDGITLPPTVDATSTKTDAKSPLGKFSEAEIVAAVALSALQPATAAVGDRCALPGAAPARRHRTKGPCVPTTTVPAVPPLADSAAPPAVDRTEITTLLTARLGHIVLADVKDFELPAIAVAVAKADTLFFGGKPDEARRLLSSAVSKARGWGLAPAAAMPLGANTSQGLKLRAFPEGGEVDDGAPLTDSPSLEPGDGFAWVVVDPLHSDFGSSVDLQGGSLVHGNSGISVRADGSSVVVVKMTLEKVTSLAADAFARLKSIVGKSEEEAAPAALEKDDIRAKLGLGPIDGDDEDDVLRSVGRKTGDATTPDDARTLWVICDDHGERFREWRSVVRSVRQANWADGWEKHHEGPPCCLELFKNWDKTGTPPLVWLETFFNKFGISEDERTGIELKALVKSIWLSGCYDQLNSLSLACIEELCRRASQLIEAYETGHGGRPNFKTVKHFLSASAGSSVVPVSLRAYAHKRCKDEVEIENLRIRAAGASGGISGEGEGQGES